MFCYLNIVQVGILYCVKRTPCNRISQLHILPKDSYKISEIKKLHAVKRCFPAKMSVYLTLLENVKLLESGQWLCNLSQVEVSASDNENIN